MMIIISVVVFVVMHKITKGMDNKSNLYIEEDSEDEIQIVGILTGTGESEIKQFLLSSYQEIATIPA